MYNNNIPESTFPKLLLEPVEPPTNPLTVSAMVLAHVRGALLANMPIKHSDLEIRFALKELLDEHFMGMAVTPALANEVDAYINFYFPLKSKAPRVFIHEGGMWITAADIMSHREYQVKMKRRQELADELSTLNTEIGEYEAQEQLTRFSASN